MLSRSVDNFLNYMTVERGVSPNTLAAYRNDLAQMVEFLETRRPSAEDGDGWSAVDEDALSEYVLHLHHQGYSDTTRARKVASARSLFGFLVQEGVIEKDPTENLSSPRVGRSLPDTLTVEEVDKLLAQASGGGSPRRSGIMPCWSWCMPPVCGYPSSSP